MRAPELRVYDDVDAVCAEAANEFVAAATAACEARGRFRVALAGGTTPCRLHRMLGDTPWRERVDWASTRFFFGDERAVYPEHANSNYRMAQDTLLRGLDIPDRHIHRMRAERRDRDTAAREYEDEIADEFGTSVTEAPPAFDLILLGMGADGHTASLFPGTDALEETRRWVVGNDVRALATSRMTFTFPLINAARRVVITITGGEKAKALRDALAPEATSKKKPPVARVEPSRGRVIYLTDRDAARLISR